MPTLEERVAFLEGQVSEQSHGLVEVRDALRHLEQRLEARFDAFDKRMEARFEASDKRIETLEQRTEVRHDSLGRRIEALEDKMSRQFVWTVGVQVTTFVAIVAALLSRG